jgi:hypothetical protein
MKEHYNISILKYCKDHPTSLKTYINNLNIQELKELFGLLSCDDYSKLIVSVLSSITSKVLLQNNICLKEPYLNFFIIFKCSQTISNLKWMQEYYTTGNYLISNYRDAPVWNDTEPPTEEDFIKRRNIEHYKYSYMYTHLDLYISYLRKILSKIKKLQKSKSVFGGLDVIRMRLNDDTVKTIFKTMPLYSITNERYKKLKILLKILLQIQVTHSEPISSILNIEQLKIKEFNREIDAQQNAQQMYSDSYSEGTIALNNEQYQYDFVKYIENFVKSDELNDRIFNIDENDKSSDTKTIYNLIM